MHHKINEGINKASKEGLPSDKSDSLMQSNKDVMNKRVKKTLGSSIKKTKKSPFEILTPTEIDDLLNAISSEEVDEKHCSKTKIKIYDFKRPDKFSINNIRYLQLIHEKFAQYFSSMLSAQLRVPCHCLLCSVDQLTYEEFIRSIPNPTTLAIINMNPLKGSTILEMDPQISFSILNRLFGGVEEDKKHNRELTDLELSVMEGVIVRILGQLREVWSNAIDLRPRLANIECSPMHTQITDKNEICVLMVFEVKIGELEDMMIICIPHSVIKPILHKLDNSYTGSVDEPYLIDDIDINLHVHFPEVQMSLKNVIDLQIGDTFLIDNKLLVGVKA